MIFGREHARATKALRFSQGFFVLPEADSRLLNADFRRGFFASACRDRLAVVAGQSTMPHGALAVQRGAAPFLIILGLTWNACP
jgi:hypothetical protein